MMAQLKGINQIGKFRRVAERLVSKMVSCEGVIGIVFIGGLVRGFTDKFSDLDIIVFLSRRDEQLRGRIYDLGSDVEKRSSIEIDLEAHFLEDFKRRRWNEVDRWEFSRARIIFDPEEKIKDVFEEKLKLPKDFWIKRIVIYSEYLKWHCCPPRDDAGTISEAWIKRGDLIAAHYCLNYTVDLLLRIIFALNKEFLPAPKWRIFYSYNLKLLPEDYKELIREAISIKGLSVRDFERRLKAIRGLWRNVLPKIEDETGLTTTELSKYYVEKILHQTWIQ